MAAAASPVVNTQPGTTNPTVPELPLSVEQMFLSQDKQLWSSRLFSCFENMFSCEYNFCVKGDGTGGGGRQLPSQVGTGGGGAKLPLNARV